MAEGYFRDDRISLTVEFIPHPLPGMHHHLNVYLCQKPGIRSTVPFDELVWNCFGKNVQPDLPSGTICEGQELPMFATFDNKSIGLRLPHGFAFRAGGQTGYEYVVLGTHYPQVRGLINGRTGHSELVLRMSPHSSGKATKRVGLFNLSAWALIPPQRVASMSGSYVYDQPIAMTPIALLTHTHAKGMDFEFWRQSAAGNRSLVWKQDPSQETYFLVPPHPLPAIRMGDKLTVRCTYNNTQSAALLVVE